MLPIEEQQRKCPEFFSINDSYTHNFKLKPWNFCLGQPSAPHDNNICFICLFRPYILSFLLVLKMEFEHLIKWVCPFKLFVGCHTRGNIKAISDVNLVLFLLHVCQIFVILVTRGVSVSYPLKHTRGKKNQIIHLGV